MEILEKFNFSYIFHQLLFRNEHFSALVINLTQLIEELIEEFHVFLLNNRTLNVSKNIKENRDKAIIIKVLFIHYFIISTFFFPHISRTSKRKTSAAIKHTLPYISYFLIFYTKSRN